MKQAFITGSTGNLGLNLIRQILLNKSFDKIICLHRQSSRLNFIGKLKELNPDAVVLVEGNVTSKEDLEKHIPEECDCVFHIAGVVGHHKFLEKMQKKVNVDACKIIAEVALKKKVKKFVHVSSLAAYIGKIKAGSELHISEKTEKNGGKSNIYYNKTKFLGEEAVREKMKDGLDATFVNPGAITGEYDIRSMSPFVKQIFRNQLSNAINGSIPLCCGEEVAKAMLKASSVGKTGENYILGGPTISLKDYFSLVMKELEVERNINYTTTRNALFLSKLNYIYASIVCCGRVKAHVNKELVIMSSSHLHTDSTKAKEELEYVEIECEELIKRNIEWLKVNDMLKKKK